MARRGHIGGEDYSDIAALIAARQQRADPRLKMAMDLLQFGMGQQQQQAQEARLERASEAARLLDEQRIAQEERRVSLAEKGAADAETERKTKAIQEGMDRGEDIAYRERVLKSGEEQKAAEQRQKEQDAALGTFEKAMEKGYLTDPQGKFTPMGEEWLKDLDPKAAERLQKVAKLGQEETYKEKLKTFKAMTPKQRKVLEQPGSEAKIEELGGSEAYKRMLAEVQQAQPAPNLTPTTAVPPPPTQPYGVPQQEEAPAYRYGTGTQVIPATGGITGPVTVPIGVEPTTPPLYEKPYANEADITNRINADPRFRPAEDIMAENLKNWWNKAPTVPAGSFPSVEDLVAKSQYATPPEPVGSPYEMPRGQQVVNPEVYMPRTTESAVPSEGQPGFMDWLMNLVREKSDQREMPFTYGSVLPPSQPLPTPVQQPGDIHDILR